MVRFLASGFERFLSLLPIFITPIETSLVKLRTKLAIPFSFRGFPSWHRLFRRHRVYIGIVCGLVFSLVIAITYYYVLLFPAETTTTFISFLELGESDFKIADSSYMYITYHPEKDDEIAFYLRFQNLTGVNSGLFNLYYNGAMTKIDTKGWESLSLGVKEIYCQVVDDYTRCQYMIDFQADDEPLFYETFACNLFEDRTGEVRLRFRLSDLGDILSSIRLHIFGLGDFDVMYAFPEPDVQYPIMMTYTYKIDDDQFLDGITIRGHNPDIERKLLQNHFISGVVIAVLASVLAALVVDVMKRERTPSI